MSGPDGARPGFLSGFLPTFGRAIGSAFRGKKPLILIAVLAAPPLLTFPAQNVPPHGRDEVVLTMVIFLYLNFLVPLTGLLFGTGILLDEASGGNLPYLFTRPVPRSSILLGKLSASLVIGTALVSISLGLTLVLFGPVPAPSSGHGPLAATFNQRAFVAVALALPAYLAVFTLLAALTRWALLGGFFYAFGVEGFLSLIPGKVKEWTLLYYSRSFLGGWESHRIRADIVLGKGGGADPMRATLVLALVTAVALVAAILLVRRKEFVGRNPGRG